LGGAGFQPCDHPSPKRAALAAEDTVRSTMSTLPLPPFTMSAKNGAPDVSYSDEEIKTVKGGPAPMKKLKPHTLDWAQIQRFSRTGRPAINLPDQIRLLRIKKPGASVVIRYQTANCRVPKAEILVFLFFAQLPAKGTHAPHRGRHKCENSS